MQKRVKIYKKLHKWPGLIAAFILFYYGVTGVFLNHREFFSGIDVNRTSLPQEFQYQNWNNAALKGNLNISSDSILIYGNIGIWATDSLFKDFRSLNDGFPKGTDNRKIFDLHKSEDGHLYAATHFGLFAYNADVNQWHKFGLDVDIKRFVAIESVGDTLYAMNRSFMFKGKSAGIQTKFKKIALDQPKGYDNRVSLFKTMWQIHSGEIFGLPGKLFVDFLGILTIFLSITGMVYFFFPGWMKRRRKRSKETQGMLKANRWSLKWHNFSGAWLFGFLIVLFFSGMFLRPPLLIAIARLKVKPIIFSHLSQVNPWYDKLRDMHFDDARNRFLISSSDGMYSLDANTTEVERFQYQPPVSVMGINVLTPYSEGAYLIGSFSGLFLWHPEYPEVYNFVQGKLHRNVSSGRPVGDFKITGLIKNTLGQLYMIDYQKGVQPLQHPEAFPDMPQNILEESKMSLWTFSLETHTGRIFGGWLGMFYILIVPLTSLLGITVVLSGYLLWRKRFKKKGRE